MTYRVIQWATGNVGSEALRSIIASPDLELVGVLVYAEEKDGLDAGEIAGVAPVGVIATRDRDKILALEADCVFYAGAMIWNGALYLEQNDTDVVDILASGKNVVSICSGHIWPEVRGPELVQALEAACVKGRSTIHGTGINPGYFLERLTPVLSGLCQRVDSVTLREVWDGTNYTSEVALFEMVGFGKSAEWLQTAPFIPILTEWIHEALHSAAHSLGRTIESFDRTLEYGLATRDVQLTVGVVPEGTVAAVGWTWSALIGGKPFVSVNNRWIADWNIPGWNGDRTHYWQLEIDGAPSIKARVALEDTYPPLPFDSGPTDRITTGIAVAVALNAIPDIVSADPGILRLPVFAPNRSPGR